MILQGLMKLRGGKKEKWEGEGRKKKGGEKKNVFIRGSPDRLVGYNYQARIV